MYCIPNYLCVSERPYQIGTRMFGCSLPVTCGGLTLYRAGNSNPSQELLYLNSEIKGLLVARIEALHGTSTVPEGENWY